MLSCCTGEFPLIFNSQNIIYNEISIVKNTLLRGALAGMLSSPIYTYLETKKMYSRLAILPNYYIYSKIILARQTLFYAILYKISLMNIVNATFISALVANIIGFPLKLYALSKSYSVFIINKKTIRLSAIMEILKASIILDRLAKVKYPIYLCDIYSHKARNSYY